MLLNKFNNWLKSSVRLVLTVLVCGLLFVASAYPAQAATSKTTDGEASLNEIQNKTDDVARSNPRGINEVTKEAQKGLNAVQGSADADKMISPDEANATTVKEKASNFFDSLTN
ncbi:hypothetical protein I4641_07570 [Waterburya agarophytonicola K14]|uniref:Low temperature-induced protein n=1 Tax=Waterburya agarophytonicola KI4 TaxID=2874699 RepID=A0A964BP52_9CYAN|nr:hypothetical protein [Waterburya agarophytonicola]MCC0176835.1 hypothetical protein [Waterburya agarophytonicola KI4]